MTFVDTGRYWLECRSASSIQPEKRQPCSCALEHTLSSICSGAAAPDHNSAGEWATHLLSGGRQRPMRRGTRRSLQPAVLRVEQRQGQRPEQLSERQLVQLRKQLAVQRRVEVEVKVEVQVEMERTIRVPMQVTIRPKARLPVLPDVQREVLRETERRVRGEVSVSRRQFPDLVMTLRPLRYLHSLRIQEVRLGGIHVWP